MKIKQLRLIQYRNYKTLELYPHEHLTVLVGENAQGKTNAAEAVYLCASGRSHRTAKDSELINWDAPYAYVRLELLRDGINRCIEMRLIKGGKKQIKIDGAPISKMGELMGCLNAVIFSPEDLKLVKEGPSERRRFMDMELSQIRPVYFYSLSNYQHVLTQRNALLKEICAGRMQEKLLEEWDELLGQYGADIFIARKGFMEVLSAMAKKMHRDISEKEELRVTYVPDIKADDRKGAYEEILCVLHQMRADDIRKGITGKGPHRDDIMLCVNDRDVRVYGSQGQQRTVALSLKLSELGLMQKATGEAPVLLLDDVMSELDEKRCAQLIEGIGSYQTILTCTSVPSRLFGDMYHVEDGQISVLKH